MKVMLQLRIGEGDPDLDVGSHSNKEGTVIRQRR
jgi:hypothetical protein